MYGKSITLHQDGVAHAALLYRPEVTDELTLSVSWLRDHVTIDLTEGEMLDLAHRLTKGVKKVRKYKRKQAQKRVHKSLTAVSEYIQNGRRK